jgi:glyoxylase-like metal-dependent hydrolase (beta-lactamase superfamily II)
MSQLQTIDVLQLGRPRVICCYRVDGDLIDPGPTACVETLLRELGDEVPQRLLLTHIHLDHAAAAGWLVRRWPHLEVWVSEIGAPHLVDPSKLIASATRLYGDDMDRLWGEILPVPEENVRVLSGGEAIDRWRVEATPGHASHHVSFLHEDEGWAFVGDVTGVRIVPGYITVPTPPPDIDVEAWQASLDVVEGWSPTLLALTHFGTYDDVDEHIERARRALVAWSDLAKITDGATFAAAMQASMSSAVEPEMQPAIGGAVPLEQQWAGLDRYWRKRAEREAEAGTAGPSR